MDIVLAAKSRTWKALIERLDTTCVVKWPVSFSHCRYVAPHPTKEGWCEPQMLMFADTFGTPRVSDPFTSRIWVAWRNALNKKTKSHRLGNMLSYTDTWRRLYISIMITLYTYVYNIYVYAVYIYIHNMWMSRSNTNFRRYLILKDLQTDSCGGDPKALACVFQNSCAIWCPVNNQPFSSTFHLWTTRPPQGLSVVYMPTLKFNSLRVYLSAKALRSTQSMRLLREDPLNQTSHWVNIPHLWGLESSTRSIWD